MLCASQQMDAGEASANDEDVETFFEGAEKLLEIWFHRPATHEIGVCNNADEGSLRSIPKDELARLLESASCHVLHTRSNSQIDSYVLSESSMFVSDRRFILKTCGRIRLLDTVEKIIHLASAYAAMPAVGNVYYSRRNFLRPELQPELYRRFEEEVGKLDNHFQVDSDGGAYCMGSLKGDRWYLYTMNSPLPNNRPDHTLEILMNEVPGDVLNCYTMAQSVTAANCTQKGGIVKLCPQGTTIHEELFDPCGYSMNGLIGETDQYVTIHVTPEPQFSYISFETNQNEECLYGQLLKVLECFRPGKVGFSTSPGEDLVWNREVAGYRRCNIQLLRLTNDTIVYAQFVKE